MAELTELTAAETWLFGQLADDEVLVADRVYSHVAPREAVYPLVVFQMQQADDVETINGVRIMSRGLWLVRVIGQVDSFSDLETPAGLIDSQLHLQSDDLVMSSIRVRPFSMVEVVDGVQFRHLGGVYELLMQTSTPVTNGWYGLDFSQAQNSMYVGVI